jgi:acetylornithine deacetylase
MNEIELTKKLIEIESVSGNETEILEFLADFLRENSAEVWQNKDFAAGVLRIRTNGNEFSKSSRAIILTGHIDTVSAGDLRAWERSPWEATEMNGKIIGLGASDMKGGLAAQFIAGLEFVKENNFESNFDLWLVAVSNEEIDGRGSRNFVKWLNEQKEFDYSEFFGVIAEPTNCENIEIGHRGNRFVRLKFKGESGHASQQVNFQKSALSKASFFLSRIDDIFENWQESFSNDFLGSPSLVPTSLKSGEDKSPNKTAPSAELILDIRTTPELDSDFKNTFNSLAEKYDFKWEYHSEPVPSSLVSKKSRVIENILKVSKLNEESIMVSPGATDQGEFVNGLKNAQIVVFGPGEWDEAHHQNEFIYIDKLSKYKTWIIDFLKEF